MIHPLIVENKKIYKETTPWALIMYEIVVNTKPELILEIGTRNGFATRTLLAGLDQNNKGILHSCDIKDCSNRARVPEQYKNRWVFHCVNSIDFHKTWNKQIDILIVDGNHSYDMAKADFYNYEKFVKTGGYIFMHDTVHWEGVRQFWTEINYPKVNLDWGDGMGLVKKT